MNKKFVQAVAGMCVFALMVALAPIGYANEGSSGNGYNTPVYKSELNFKAEYSNGKVSTSWSDYKPEGFDYYKVIRSESNPNPVYPDDGYIYYGDATSYVDMEPPTGVVYYRVCSIASPNRYCSTVIKINSEGSSSAMTSDSDNDSSDDSDDEKGTSDNISPADINLEAELKDNGVKLTWDVDGPAPYGFKVAESTVHEEPTYPVMSGDSYRYLSDPKVRSYMDARVEAGKTYHYRVCQYLGGSCGSYSNAVSITIPEDFKSEYISENVETKKEAIAAKAEAFADAKKHKYNEAIDYLREQNVVEGYDDGTFRPDHTINRAEFMKIIIAAKFSKEYISLSMAGNCFSDVTSDQWFAPYICMAKNEGIISGYPDGTFGPEKEITFAEAAKILAEVYNLDFTNGDSWYEGYVKALQDNNYIPDSVSALTKQITRAEMAELIWRIKMQKKEQSHATLLDK